MSLRDRATALRPYLFSALEEVDAGIFSGDVLWNPDERDAIKEYIARWSRAIATAEQGDSQPDNGEPT